MYVYFIAICGTAMGSLAGMMKSLGHRVTGSDQHVYPPMSTFLEEMGIEIQEGFDPGRLEPPPDLVVIGNVVSRGNPEVEAVLNRKLRYTSFPEVLREFFIRGKYSIVITGTHGKTTTSALLAWLLESAGRDPSFMIGGIPRNFNSSYKLGDGEHFVIEGDEYDTAFFDKGPKFLHYLTDLLVINNVEFDHADIYRSIDDIKVSFRRLINIIPGNGLIVASGDDPNVVELLPRAFTPVETFGFGEDSKWRAEEIRFTLEKCDFRVLVDGHPFGNFRVPLIGIHGVRNALAAIVSANFLGLSVSEIQNGLRTFKGIKRRLETRGVVNGIAVLDDFAHHPTEVKATLDGLRGIHPDVRIWAVFEPASATSARSIFEKEYSESFDSADKIILARVPRPERAREDKPMSIERIVEAMRGRGKDALYIPTVPEIVDHLRRTLKSGDMVVIMSNSAFGGIQEKLLDALKDQNRHSPGGAGRGPVTSHQSPVTSHQSPITNHQSPITNHQSP